MSAAVTSSRHACRVSTPGRVCLFGEHQDYLELPVISAAISLRFRIEGVHRDDTRVIIHAPDIRKDYAFDINDASSSPVRQNFLRYGLKVLRERGYAFSRGFNCSMGGEIPIRAGTSSSSAMVVSWITFLSRMSDQGTEISPEECALLAHRAEVIESGGVGGRMDQYATSVGGVLYQSFSPSVRIERLPAIEGAFVLGDSQSFKDTQGVLSRVKSRVLSIVNEIRKEHADFSLHTVAVTDLDRYTGRLDDAGRDFLRATVRNRTITRDGLSLLKKTPVDGAALGTLLNEQHTLLARTLGISTEKIDRMLNAALRAGALGGKINGSGGGGCMFAYAPENTEAVAAAVEAEGGRAYIVRTDEGSRVEMLKAMP